MKYLFISLLIIPLLAFQTQAQRGVPAFTTGEKGNYELRKSIIINADTYSSDATTLHLYIFAANNDATHGKKGGIGKSVQKSVDLLSLRYKWVADVLKVKFKYTLIDGSNYNKSQVISTTKNIKCGENDILIWINLSHGFKFRDATSKWTNIIAMSDLPESPSSSEIRNNNIAFSNIIEILKKSSARLVFCYAETCQNVIAMDSKDKLVTSDAPAVKEVEKKALIALFIETKGQFALNATKHGLYSWGDPTVGGICTNAHVRAMDEVLMTSSDARWENLLDKTVFITSDITKKYKKDGKPAPQIPIWDYFDSKDIIPRHDSGIGTIKDTGVKVNN